MVPTCAAPAEPSAEVLARRGDGVGGGPVGDARVLMTKFSWVICACKTGSLHHVRTQQSGDKYGTGSGSPPEPDHAGTLLIGLRPQDCKK